MADEPKRNQAKREKHAETARILRAAAGVDVAGLMAQIDDHGLANYREGLDDKSGKGADATDVTIKRGEIESSLRLVLAQRVPPRFPTMLRKMWSGGEVQAWIDANWDAAAPQAKEQGNG